MDVLLTAISTVGFPIAMCVYIMVVMNKSIKENTNMTRELVVLINAKLK